MKRLEEMKENTKEQNSGRKLYTGLLSHYAEKKRLLEIRKYVKGNVILDLGCGYGKMSTLFEKEDYYGVDINLNALNKAKMDYGALKTTFFLTLDEFHQTPVLFDTIIMAAVIEHLADPVPLLLSLKNRLKPEGIIILTTPTHVANNIHKIGSKIYLFSQGAAHEHVKIYTQQDLRVLSELLNMEMISYKRFILGLNQIAIFQMVTRNKPGG